MYNPSTLDPIVHLRGDYEMGGGVWDQLYMRRPQKLSKERLNLNPWGGFHELKLNRLFELNIFSASYDIGLVDKGYIYLYFDRSNEAQSHGLRISRNKMFPSIYFIRNENGKFLKKEVIHHKTIDDVYKIQIDYNAPNIIITSNHNVIFQKELAHVFKDGITLAWGGSSEYTPVWVDNIYVYRPIHGELFKTSFSKFEIKITPNQIYFILFFILSYTLILFYIKEDKRKSHLNLSLSFILTTAYLLHYNYIAERYYEPPGNDLDQIQFDYQNLKKKYFVDLERKETNKIFIFGGSKTYGDGARMRDNTWVRIIANKILKHKDKKNKMAIFNWGIASAQSKNILNFVKEQRKYRPKIAIFLVGVNDWNTEIFLINIRNIIILLQKIKTRIIFIEESTYANELALTTKTNSYENFQRLLPFCDQNQDITCIGLHDKIYNPQTRKYDSGIRWVEWVHFNSYGQILFAELIFPIIRKEIEYLQVN